MKRKIPIWFAFIMVGAIGSFLYFLVDQKAEAATVKTPKVWSNEDCLHCHNNKKVLRRMQDTRGDPTYCQAAFDRLAKNPDGATESDYSKK